MSETHTSSNKLAVIHVLAGLITNPLLFSDNRYRFSITDFPEQFHRIIFGAVEHLATEGLASIQFIDIDEYLKPYTIQYEIYCKYDGNTYIQRALELYDSKKFDYYYQTLKKHSLLNRLNNAGIDTRDIYDPDIVDPIKSAQMYANFDALSVNDIINIEEVKVIEAKQEFGSNSDCVENRAGDGLRELKERFKKTPDMGLPLLSPKLTTILRGQRRGCLFMESAPAGTGKALPNSSRIPTPTGWKTIGEIRPGDFVFDAKGKPTKVLDIFPQGEKEVYQVRFLDGRTVRCCSEHLWSFNTSGQRQSSIDNRIFYTKTLQDIRDNYNLKTSSGWNILIPQQQAVEYPEKNHFLPPYIMGLLLGDGSFREQKTSRALTFSSINNELPLSIANTMGWGLKKQKSTYSWIYELPKDQWIKTKYNIQKNVWVSYALSEHPDLINTSSETKFIPRNYLEDSIDHRFDLLNGLLDTDGSVSLRGVIRYFTTSKQLKDDVVELARSLGFQTSVSIDRHKFTNICYTVYLMGSPELKSKLFKLSSKHSRLMNWVNRALNQQRNHKHYQSNPIISIDDLGYKETMTCFLVDNDEHLFLTDDFVVTHNSRRANGEACHLAIPEYYDIQQQKWVHTGFCEPVLIISTELEEYECQQMWMAFVSGVSEAHIKDGRYAPGEEERVDRAIDLIEQSKLMFVSITNYDVDDITGIIKKYKQLYNINYVFFDYLGETLKITSSMARQTKIQGLRTDQILLMFSSQLKDLAKTLDIFIWTATQLSGNYKEDDTLDASYLRSAKSLADKVDCGLILVPVREKDRSVIETYCSKGFELEPNFVMHVYKVRAGSYQNIKIYFYFDRATCGVYDCFVTNSRGELLDIADTNIELILDDTVDTSKETNLDDFDF